MSALSEQDCEDLLSWLWEHTSGGTEHASLVAEVAAIVARHEAEVGERIAVAIEALAYPTDRRPAPGRHAARGETLAHNVGITEAAACARAASVEAQGGAE